MTRAAGQNLVQLRDGFRACMSPIADPDLGSPCQMMVVYIIIIIMMIIIIIIITS